MSEGKNVYTRGCIQQCPNAGASNNGIISGIFCCQSDICNNIASPSSLTSTVNYNKSNASKIKLNNFFILIFNLKTYKTVF